MRQIDALYYIFLNILMYHSIIVFYTLTHVTVKTYYIQPQRDNYTDNYYIKKCNFKSP